MKISDTIRLENTAVLRVLYMNERKQNADENFQLHHKSKGYMVEVGIQSRNKEVFGIKVDKFISFRKTQVKRLREHCQSKERMKTFWAETVVISKSIIFHGPQYANRKAI